jgi:alkanesulfonate monooxygenase SsuD/methylene tetrahydromethanopterin reductase-like flavin-dependent oxidoreductase (luciferase family)
VIELGIHTFAERTPDPATGLTVDRTRRIRLTSAVTVVSSDDPVRVFQDFAEKILDQHRIFGNRRFLMQMSVGTMPHADVMRSIELYGTRVAPIVRAEVARREASWPTPAGAGH